MNVKNNTCSSYRAIFALNTEHINTSKSHKIHENLFLSVTAVMTAQEKTCQCVQQTGIVCLYIFMLADFCLLKCLNLWYILINMKSLKNVENPICAIQSLELQTWAYSCHQHKTKRKGIGKKTKLVVWTLFQILKAKDRSCSEERNWISVQ